VKAEIIANEIVINIQNYTEVEKLFLLEKIRELKLTRKLKLGREDQS